MRNLARLLGLSSEKPEIVNPAEISPVDTINAAVVADIADQPQNIHEIHQANLGTTTVNLNPIHH